MHRLLHRQLKKCLGTDRVPADLYALIEAVDLAYQQSDADRQLIERSMELSSQELFERNQELLRRNSELSAMRESALDCIISMAPDGAITEFNPAAERTFGYRRQDVLGRPLGELIVPPQSREPHRQALGEFLSTGVSRVIGRRIEGIAQRADGSVFPVEMAISVVHATDRPTFTAYLRDITERKQYEQTLERERDFTTAVLETVSSLVIVVDDRGRIAGFNRACEQLTGWRFEEVRDRYVWDVVMNDQDAAWAREIFRGGLDLQRIPAQRENPWRTRWGTERLIAWSNRPILDADGRPQFLIGTGTDITDQKLAEQLERDRARVLEMVAQNRALGETLAELARLVERQRPGMMAMVLLAQDGRLHCGAAPNVPPQIVAIVDDSPIAGQRSICASAAHTGKTLVCADIAAEHPCEELRELALACGVRSVWAIPVRNGGGEVVGTLTGLFRIPQQPQPGELQLLESMANLAGLAMEHQRLTDRLAHQARHDPLTGLPNRMLLEDRLNQALLQAQRNGQQVGVFFIDLDGFKIINDTLGHHAGDRLLKQISKRLEATTRQADTLARMGGDEFTLMSPLINTRDDAATVAHRLLDAIRAPFVLEGRELIITGSVGVAVYPDDGTDAATLQRNADAAMYRAKSLGRNTFEYFNPHINAAAMERFELESQLRRALAQSELTLFYQPQLSPDGVVGVEALVRWLHPTLGLISPARFIPLAEESGLIIPIGAWVIRAACAQAKRWSDALGRALHLSVNVSPLQFAQPSFVPDLATALRTTGLDPHALELEITESMLMHSPAEAAQTLANVRKLGVGVAIDDFGTGYSSLAYLHQLPIDTLKIDQTFVQEIDDTTVNQSDTTVGREEPPGNRVAVIRAIASLAQSLNLNLIAEGVETEQQRRCLLELGCTLMQGYLFSQPVPADQIPALIARLDAQHRAMPMKQPA